MSYSEGDDDDDDEREASNEESSDSSKDGDVELHGDESAASAL